MQLVTVWQSKGQLDHIYRDDAENVLNQPPHQANLPERHV